MYTAASIATVRLLEITMQHYYEQECILALNQMYGYY